MAQNVLDYTYDPTGNELMDEYLPKMAENCLTNNSGSTRPTYAVENTVWVDTSDNDTWRYKIYDGTSDIVLFEFDNITKKINFPNITGVFRFKGSVATVSALPATGNLPGDVYNVEDTGANYAWNGSEWDKLSENLEWGRIVGLLSNQTDLQNALDAKQPTLVSGTNIKTINNTSLLGAGNIAVQPTLVSGTNIKTINNNSILGSGNLTLDGLPTQTGQSGKFLTTDGTTASWESVSVNPDNKSITLNTSNQLQTVGVINSRDSSTAIKTWTGTKNQYDAIVSKDANTLYNITDDTDVSLTILEALYPVGSIYITTANTCPLSALISGSTWVLRQTGIVTSVNSNVPVKGNGITLGLTNGTENAGLNAQNSSSYGKMLISGTGNYGEAVGSTHSGNQLANSKSVGLTTDDTKSGIVGTVTSSSFSVNIFERTA